jgi:heme-degrading monooxygenase HmoA
MFARKLSIRLKPDMLAEFTRLVGQKIVPLLREQKGFKDAIVLAVAGSRDVLALSLWETREDAEAYHSSTHKGVLKALENVVEASPRVGTPEVLHTTLYASHAAVSVA